MRDALQAAAMGAVGILMVTFATLLGDFVHRAEAAQAPCRITIEGIIIDLKTAQEGMLIPCWARRVTEAHRAAAVLEEALRERKRQRGR